MEIENDIKKKKVSNRKVQESVAVNFDEWADRITFDEFRILGKLRDFSKSHPEYRKDVLKLKDKIRGIFADAYMESINEASYGGAFDIADDQYFTREDLDDLIDYIEEELNRNLLLDRVTVYDADISDHGKMLNLEIVTDKDGFYEEYHTRIDMRKIRTPRDLVKVYGTDAIREFREKLESDGIEFGI